MTGASKAALGLLLGRCIEDNQQVYLIDKEETVSVAINHGYLYLHDKYAQVSVICNSNLPLDVTRNMELLVIASFVKRKSSKLEIIPGEGVGKIEKNNQISISSYAINLLQANLNNLIPDNFTLRLELIIPKGKLLAEKTSNKSFGILEGLSIIGTSSDPQVSASPNQLQEALQ